MGKPSIFSKEYEKRMRKRKRRTIIFVSLLAAAALVLSSNNIKSVIRDKTKLDKIFSFYKQEDKKEDKKDDAVQEVKPAAGVQDTDKMPVNENIELSYDVTLNNGANIKAIYENKDGVKKFKYINTEDTNISFSVNPSSTAMVIYDNKSQDIWFLDISGKVQDISRKTYKSRKSKTTFKKETILDDRPGYVWCESPRFIDDENIAYFSQLPYISKSTKKYLWAVNVKKKDTHINEINVNGENISFGNIVEKGLEVILDNGSVKFIKIKNGDILVNK